MCTKTPNAVLVRGSVVRSKSGHDANSFYVVVKCAEESAWIADGRRRKVEQPKRKNIKHLALTTTVVGEEDLATNKKIRRALWGFNFGPDSPVAG